MHTGSDAISRHDRGKLYLGYLDKEMLIMGVLSAFCAATLALVIGKMIGLVDSDPSVGSKAWSKGSFYLVFGSVSLVLSALYFYRQRSHLAWCYGQIALTLAKATSSEEELSDWLDEADSWNTWIDYRWAFAYLSIGYVAYLVALISGLGEAAARPWAKWTFTSFCLIALALVWRLVSLMKEKPYVDHPVQDVRHFLGLTAWDEERS